MDKNTVVLTSPEVARKDARYNLGLATKKDRDAITAQLTRLNDLAATYKYDGMKLVLGILSGTAEAYSEEGKHDIAEALSNLLGLFTELDVILEVHNNFQEILGSGSESKSTEEIWAKIQRNLKNSN